MSELNPNAISGLASNLNTREIIGRFMEIEKRRMAPVESRKEKKQVELESWNMVKTEIEKFHDVSKSLTKMDIWDAKRVESSDPDVIVATARRNAKPGRTVVAVDSLAMAHQIASQGFKRREMIVGTGVITIQVGDEEERPPIEIRIKDTNNTLEGVQRAINDSGAEVEAFIVKTGDSENPYQLMLTSKSTGERGRIRIDVNMDGGEVPPPNYDSSYDSTGKWAGVKGDEPLAPIHAKGSSTPITGVRGNFTGKEDVTFTFTATQGGIVNSEQGVELIWNDNLGRTGNIQLNKYNYVPGSNIELVDGLSVVFSDGELISGDSFSFSARTERSDLLWWMSPEERAPKVFPTSEWSRKATDGGIKVTGHYDGEEDQTIVFRIEGSGQVGGPKKLFLHYEFTETGETGRINIGSPYLSGESGDIDLEGTGEFSLDTFTEEVEDLYDDEFGVDVDEDGRKLPFSLNFNARGPNSKKLSIGHGLFVEVPPGVLNDGDTAYVDLRAQVSNSLWWLPEEDRGISGHVNTVANWEPYLDEYGNPVSKANISDGLLPFGMQFSEAQVSISGYYTEDLPKTYTFTVEKEGSVGVTRLLELRWEDEEGNTGYVEVGEGYKPGTPVYFDSGLEVALGKGHLVEGDSFVITTDTPTVQPPTDAVLRLGASDLGGGIEIRRPENVIDDIITGVELELLRTSEKPVTITITADTEKAKELIHDFVEAYNTLNNTVTELTKYDQQSNTAGPLLSDRNIFNIYSDVANTTISAVKGLPQSTNMLFSIGLKLDDKGHMSLDEGKLEEKISEDFAAVANIFRSNGISDASGITFLGLTDKTKISPVGYSIDIEEVATRGTLVGTRLPPRMRIHDKNNEIIIKADGRKSEPLELRKDVYSIPALAREIQSKLNDDKRLGKRRIQVTADEGRLKFISGSYGKNSSIKVEPVEKKTLDGFGLSNAIATQGRDVKVRIDGIEAVGRGQLFTGKEGTDAEGLRLFSTIGEDQLVQGTEAKIVITKGIATQLNEKLDKVNEPSQGDIKRVTQDISQQISNYNQQVKRLEDRMETKKTNLQIKFAKLESSLGRLKAQQKYLGQQLASLGGGASKAEK